MKKLIVLTTLGIALLVLSDDWGAGVGSYDRVVAAQDQGVTARDAAYYNQAVSLDQAVLRAETGRLISSFYPSVSDVALPSVVAKAALVGDVETAEVYFGLHEEERWPLASITKLMSAVIVFQEMDLSQEIVVTPKEAGGRNGGVLLETGERYSAHDLVRATLMASNNEAIESLAVAYGWEKFMSRINSLAREIGMTHAHFVDPTGFSVANQATPRDLLKLVRFLYQKYPEILEITREKEAVIREREGGKTRELKSTHAFAGQDAFLGGKTGYTEDAGGNLLSIFRHEGRPIAIVVLGAENRSHETEQLFTWFTTHYRLGE